MVCLFAMIAHSRIPVTQSYSMAEGLPSERVFCAVQDHPGFMWFGTDAGLCVFDGRRFVNYTTADGLAFNEIAKLYMDSKNRLWIFHPQGAITLRADRQFYHAANHALIRQLQQRGKVRTVREDMFGNVWFGYTGGALARLSAADALVFFASPHQGEFTYAPDFYLTADNEWWIIYSSRFYQYDYDNDTFVLLVGPVITAQPHLHFHFISGSNALFLTSAGLERMINKNYGVIISKSRLSWLESIQVIHYDAHNGIWLSDGRGRTLYFQYKKGIYSPWEKLLPDCAVRQFYSDQESNLWVCTDGNGLFRFSAASLTGNYLTSHDGLPSNHIVRLLPWQDHQIIALTAQGEIVRIRSNNQISRFLPHQHAFTPVAAAADTLHAELVVASADGLLISRPGFVKWMRAEEIFSPAVSFNHPQIIHDVICQDKKWRVAAGSAVYQLQLKQAGVNTRLEYQSGQTISRLRAVSDDSYLAAIDQQVWLISNGKQSLPFSPRLESEITDMMLLPDSMLLVGTVSSGMLAFRHGKLIFQFHGISMQSTGRINRMVRSNEGILWLACQNGIFRMLIKDDQPGAVEHFNMHDGLLTNAINDLIIDQEIFAATPRGINFFAGNLIKYIARPPSVYLTRFVYGNQSYPLSDSIRFRFRKSPLHIEFESPVFHAADAIRFQYKLSGFSEEWTETENRFTEYSSLSPGTYIFQVQARRVNSGWSKPVFVRFEIIAPFYGTLWFRLLVANSLIFILYLLLRSMVAAKYRKRLAVYDRERALEKERNRISRDMHDDLGADLTNIVILSRIARQTIPRSQQQEDVVDKIEMAANDVINKMNEIIWALNPSNDTLANLIAYLHRYLKEHLETAHIELHIDIPSQIPNLHLQAGLRRNIFLVVKESVHNAVKHSHASRIEAAIRLERQNQELQIEIADNGIGFDVAERTGKGNGLLNMKKRMDEIMGAYFIESAPGKGTRVFIKAPLPPEALN
jgi:signal transduction histidine kinase/ligand-binding sensor domain-containing protein